MSTSDGYPRWITPAALPSVAANRNLYTNPLLIVFSGPNGTKVSQINGSLPTGLTWSQSGSNIIISGDNQTVTSETVNEITWRLTTRNGTVSDRTYSFVTEPIINAPSWDGQDPFLGYATSLQTQSYKVTATTDTGLPIIYSIAQFAAPPGIKLNGKTGDITYVAPEVFADSMIYFVVKATAGTTSSTLKVSIGLLYANHAPAWITHEGLLATTRIDDFVEVVLESYSNTVDRQTYHLVSSQPPLPLTLTPEGLLYGHAPVVTHDTTYVFTIAANNSLGNSYRRFEIIATRGIHAAPLVWKNTNPDLGDWQDGRYVVIDVGASAVGTTVEHTIVGGMIPRNLTLDRTLGLLQGFLEFQTRDREYYFEVRADTANETILRRMRINVQRSISHPYMDVLVPITGSIRDLHRRYQANVVTTSWIPDGLYTPAELLEEPYVRLASGLSYLIDDPALEIAPAVLHTAPTHLMVSNIDSVASGSNTVVYFNNIHDSAAGAEPFLYQNSGIYFTLSQTMSLHLGRLAIPALPVKPVDWIVQGTRLRIRSVDNHNIWMQGTVVQWLSNILTLDIEQTSGVGSAGTWEIIAEPAYPPSMLNIRRDLIPAHGWVTSGGGKGTTFISSVDDQCSQVLWIKVVNPGTGYVTSPEIVITGEGTGATAVADLTIIGVRAEMVGTGFIQGQAITLNVPSNDPAIITVAKTDGRGCIVELQVTYGGTYKRFPWGLMTILSPNPNGEAAMLWFDVGVGPVTVTNPGHGYKGSTTIISVSGYEMLPDWQSSWFPYLYVGNINNKFQKTLERRSATYENLRQYLNVRWPMQHLVLRAQGLLWTGNTTFDNGLTTLDGDSTWCVEWLEPSDERLDARLYDWDSGHTAEWRKGLYDVWGTTLLDEHYTLFDFYRTIFDTAPISTHSRTEVNWLVRLLTQQISGHNPVF